MPGFETEKSEGYHPVNSHSKENRESNGSIILYPNKHKTTSSKSPFALCIKHKPVSYTCVSVILNFALLIILIILIIPISLLVRANRLSAGLSTCLAVQMSCPNDWVGYQGRCYYFSKAEGNWTSSKRHCSSFNASLAVIDSQEEMDFMMRYKGSANFWLGLERNLNQSWVWINGTIFNGWFTILGGGSCAYMNRHGIVSSSCSSEVSWICSKSAVI